MYCSPRGASSPYECRSDAISAAVAPSPSICTIGSPGTRWISRNTTVTTSHSTGSVVSVRFSNRPPTRRTALVCLSDPVPFPTVIPWSPPFAALRLPHPPACRSTLQRAPSRSFCDPLPPPYTVSRRSPHLHPPLEYAPAVSTAAQPASPRPLHAAVSSAVASPGRAGSRCHPETPLRPEPPGEARGRYRTHPPARPPPAPAHPPPSPSPASTRTHPPQPRSAAVAPETPAAAPPPASSPEPPAHRASPAAVSAPTRQCSPSIAPRS